jgi:elongation factor Ts
MANITAQDIAKLRAQTDAPMLECKKALEAENGNFEKAAEWLRKNSTQKAEKKSARIAGEGTVAAYIHGGRVGVMVEVNCETDFSAKNEKFLELAKNIAMHIAAAKPTYVRSSEVPAAVVAKEKEILMAQLGNSKPAAVLEKIAEGKIAKYYEENCLENQKYIREDSKTILEVVNEVSAKIGEKITIRRFTRYEMGEGLEKKEQNFAEEVAAQTGKAAPKK